MNIYIETENLLLKKLDEVNDDLSDYLTWLRDLENNRFIESARSDFEFADLLNYIREKNENPNAILLGIFLKPHLKLIGTIKLEPISIPDSTAWIGLMIGDVSSRGKGYGFEATRSLINYAKEKMDLSEILLGVDKRNLPAIKLYNKLGFQILSESLSAYKMNLRL